MAMTKEEIDKLFKPTTEQSLKDKNPSQYGFGNRLKWTLPNVPVFEPSKDKINRVRLIPFPSEGTWYKQFPGHKGIGSAAHNLPCLDEIGLRCPACTEHERYRLPEFLDEDLAKKHQPSPQFIVWVKDRNPTKEEYKHIAQPWLLNRQRSEWLQETFTDKEGSGIFPLDDMQHGYDILFEMGEESFKNRKYYEIVRFDVARNSTPLASSQKELETILSSIMRFLPAEKKLLQYLSPEEFEKKIIYTVRKPVEDIAQGEAGTSEADYRKPANKTVSTPEGIEYEATADGDDDMDMDTILAQAAALGS